MSQQPPAVLLIADHQQGYGTTLKQLAVALDGLLLPDAAALRDWLDRHSGNLWLIAAGHSCQDSLALARRHAERCCGAMLLIPQGATEGSGMLPFPSVTICPRPDARQPSLITCVTLASLWGSRLETLPILNDGTPGLQQLLDVFQHLRQHHSGWPLGEI